MPANDPPPRMPPVATDALTPEQRAFLGKWSGGFFKDADKHPVLLTFAHNPALADVFSSFNIHLLTASTLPVKQRQIAIMRVAWLTNATFMWSSHLSTSMTCGLSPDMFEPIKVGASDPWFSPFERSVITATEELLEDHRVSDTSWASLMAEWSEAQMLDFLFTVGAYTAIAGVMSSIGVQRMPELLELAERYGAPGGAE